MTCGEPLEGQISRSLAFSTYAVSPSSASLSSGKDAIVATPMQLLCDKKKEVFDVVETKTRQSGSLSLKYQLG